MPKMAIELSVEMEDGATYAVVATQRDAAKFEVQSFGWPLPKAGDRAGVMFFRFMAWAASERQQITRLTWPEFDAQCVEAWPMGYEEGEPGAADDAADPGQ